MKEFIPNKRGFHSTYMTRKEIDSISKATNGLCAICKKPEIRLGFNLAIDHCHSTHKIRGLLCFRCNTAIGLLQDDVLRLEVVNEYINKDYSESKTISYSRKRDITIFEKAKNAGLSVSTVNSRLSKGMTIEDALKPVQINRKRNKFTKKATR